MALGCSRSCARTRAPDRVMAQTWQTIDRAETDAGTLELRRRGERDFLILIGDRVLMNSHANRSELALATLALTHLAETSSPRVLIGGLGMGCTLRAALDILPRSARVDVSELSREIERWCRGPLAVVSGSALSDARAQVAIEDVAERIAGCEAVYDAILLDLYEGPHAATAAGDPCYGARAISRTRRSLRAGGVLAVWSEDPDPGFERRLRAGGFSVESRRPGRGGRRHAVTLARLS